MKLDSFAYEGCEEPVLENVDFYVEYGKVTLLSGLSGCGKSTLLSLINGVIPRMVSGSLKGTVFIDGKSTEGSSMSRISARVGSVLQNAELQIVHQEVEDEIAFGCENFGVEPERIEERVERGCRSMGLDRRWKTRTLSGGQKQKLVTAATLAMETDILIFDEPLANLDHKGAVELLTLLRRLAGAGKAVLLVEHRLDIVLPYADEVWEIKEGTVTKVEEKSSYLRDQISVIRDRKEDGQAVSARPALRVRGLNRSFGSRTILNRLNCDVFQGERILLLGENGCGKSTLLHILARLLKPEDGTVEQFLDPCLGRKAGKRWFRTVGVVYQNPNYQLFMPSVEEEIAFGAGDKEYAMEVAGRFGLERLLKRHPHSLSEGQKRRVTIAAILAQKPRLLLLDEPTVGQDYAGLRRMVEEINRIHREQENTMITITHDMRCAAALCDRALWLEGGRVRYEGGKELADQFFDGKYYKGSENIH